MRTTMVSAALLACVVGSANAQVIEPPKKEAITDATIINLCGGSMSKLAQFGFPTNIWADRGNKPEQDDVYLGYGAFGFKIRDNVVRVCFLFKRWQGPIRGIHIGDDRESVLKVLGNPRMTVKDKEGAVTAYGYDLKELNANFFANFDKDGKVWRVEVSLK